VLWQFHTSLKNITLKHYPKASSWTYDGPCIPEKIIKSFVWISDLSTGGRPGQGSLVAGRSPPFSARSVWVGRSSFSTPQEGHDANLEGAVMIVPRVGTVEVTVERETTSTDNVWQEWLPSTRTNLVIGDQFGPVDIQDVYKAPVEIQLV